MAARVSFASRLKSWFGISWGGVSAGNFDNAVAWSLGLPPSTVQGVTAPYAQHPTVAVAIQTIATDAAAVGWEVYAEGDRDNALEDHPLEALFESPNPYMSGNDLFVASFALFEHDGEVFWYYPDLRLGEPGMPGSALARNTGGITCLRGSQVRIVAERGDLAYYFRDGSGTETPLDPDRLTHFKRYNPYDPLRGLSKLAALDIEIQADHNAAAWNAGFFGDQNGVPTGVIKPPAGVVLPSDERDGFLKRWNARHTSKRRTGILPPGFDYQEIGASPKDMDHRSLREYSREQILGVFGVPPFYAGVLDKANYANAREQKDIYWHGTITRLLTYFEGVLNADFLPKIGVTGVELCPDWESVKALTENLQEKVTIAKDLFAMGFTKRQINERLELGMTVDDNEDADVGYLPLGLLPVDQAMEPRSIAGPVNDPNAPPAPPQGEQPPQGRSLKLLATQPAPDRSARRAASWRSLAYRTVDLERKFDRTVRRHFHGIRSEVLANLNGLRGWSIKRGILKAAGDNLFDVNRSKKNLQDSVKPIYSEALKRGVDGVLQEVGVEITFPTPAPSIIAELTKLTQRITRIDDTVELALRESMAEGVAAGESIPQLASRVRDVMDASLSRSATIARTETGFAFNGGRYSTMANIGINRVEWLSAKDDRVRDSHEAVDGQVSYVGTPFGNGLLYPLDPSAPPEEVINCRCVALPVVEAV